jgi:GntR family transcriptional regulator/MocR family aminotransferase
LLLTADLESAEGRAAVERFYETLVPTLRAPPVLVRSHAGHFMDKPDNVISLINLATVRSLEDRWGYSLDPLRFRANIYIDGARPWEEFDWIGGSLRVGDAVMRVDRRNGRCGATNVDPWTGRRDRDLPSALRSAFGHKDLGVYLMTEQSGAVVVGDQVATPEGRGDQARPMAAVAGPLAAGKGRFICRGCYYIYDETAGAPDSGIAPGTTLSQVPDTWRCPDCGTDKGKFQPYLVMADATASGA